MKWWSAWFASALISSHALVAQELPTHEGEEQLEIEPPLLIQSRSADGNFVLTGKAAPPPDADLDKIERDLARAKRNATGADRLYKAGIISKVESEERVLKVVRLEARLAEARLAVAKRSAEPSDGEATEAGSEADNADVAAAEEAAKRATEERQRAELEAAFRNLQRQQKLLALGSGRKSDVNRAEQKLAELQRTQQ